MAFESLPLPEFLYRSDDSLFSNPALLDSPVFTRDFDFEAGLPFGMQEKEPLLYHQEEEYDIPYTAPKQDENQTALDYDPRPINNNRESSPYTTKPQDGEEEMSTQSSQPRRRGKKKKFKEPKVDKQLLEECGNRYSVYHKKVQEIEKAKMVAEIDTLKRQLASFQSQTPSTAAQSVDQDVVARQQRLVQQEKELSDRQREFENEKRVSQKRMKECQTEETQKRQKLQHEINALCSQQQQANERIFELEQQVQRESLIVTARTRDFQTQIANLQASNSKLREQLSIQRPVGEQQEQQAQQEQQEQDTPHDSTVLSMYECLLAVDLPLIAISRCVFIHTNGEKVEVAAMQQALARWENGEEEEKEQTLCDYESCIHFLSNIYFLAEVANTHHPNGHQEESDTRNLLVFPIYALYNTHKPTFHMLLSEYLSPQLFQSVSEFIKS